ncbi:hypothetical protein OG352_28215 [Streptomyces sp. NBC_01485]|uniref:hypothetical protein n=1 Tax=Streptomyces sp. NBC_01485 TaxID=2903884 RepID=UPI002E2EBB91|nr:hypothetical protein [Streptomyces sp. NBC_01485]
MDLSFYKSDLAEELREEGRAEVWAKSVLIILETRGIDAPEEVRERITGCYDLDLLRHWLARAITVASAAEVFGDGDEHAS